MFLLSRPSFPPVSAAPTSERSSCQLCDVGVLWLTNNNTNAGLCCVKTNGNDSLQENISFNELSRAGAGKCLLLWGTKQNHLSRSQRAALVSGESWKPSLSGMQRMWDVWQRWAVLQSVSSLQVLIGIKGCWWWWWWGGRGDERGGEWRVRLLWF